MQLRQPRTSKRSGGVRSFGRTATVQAPRPAPEQRPRQDRDAGGPEDRALYHCHCGFVFQANVSASVGCPHCGSAQAW
ncbi:hypothetical protein [Conexibacter sp. CPCC 206217]|uniref:hypothetical protein n=1 Tax=Conexibacter sp. CPCC 206217 TaxID=3064574 RepID=UPI002727DD46|nr:hypothetical protein [Conexibacter sp. CPCC 206217]MDO8213657.1 hypothetical protein [Conexibacter sp. CPCC 206217]